MEITTNLIDLTERKISNTYGFEFYFNNTTAIKTKPIVLNSFLPFIKKRSKFKNLQGVFNLFFVLTKDELELKTESSTCS